MGKSYMSFGCSACDSLFGDFGIHEMMIDNYGDALVIDTLKIDVDFPMHLRKDIPHWCHPGKHPFCDEVNDLNEDDNGSADKPGWRVLPSQE